MWQQRRQRYLLKDNQREEHGCHDQCQGLLLEVPSSHSSNLSIFQLPGKLCGQK